PHRGDALAAHTPLRQGLAGAGIGPAPANGQWPMAKGQGPRAPWVRVWAMGDVGRGGAFDLVGAADTGYSAAAWRDEGTHVDALLLCDAIAAWRRVRSGHRG